MRCGAKDAVQINGPQFISNTFEDYCAIEHERIPPKMPNMNAHIESFHRIMEDDCMSRFEFATYGEAYEAITDFMDFYNHRRIHQALMT
nr:integrase core domain-containing protein [Roseburia sp. 1XD42-34]